jgi:hypothetical protein
MDNFIKPRFGAWMRANALRTVAGLSVALVGVVPMLSSSLASASAPAVAVHVVALGNTISSNCSTDITLALNEVLASAVSGDEIKLAHDGCYLANGTIWLTDKSGVSIDGNGATIWQPSYPGGNVVLPILQLSGDTHIAVTSLELRGPYGDGNEYTEGDYGLKLTGDTGVSIRHLTILNVEGDWVAVYPSKDGALNTNISIDHSEFLGAGYHGITIESADGLMFDHDTFYAAGSSGVDLEYDTYPTVFVHGQPTQGAEDNVTFENSQWSYIQGLWVTSGQGQQVQENNLRLIDNTLVGMALTVGIIGNQTAPNSGLLIKGNVSTTPATGVWGGSSSPIWLRYVNHVRIIDNSTVVADGTPNYYPNDPYMAAVQVYGNSGVTIKHNIFSGAKSTLLADASPWSGTTSHNINVCSDSYGVHADDETSAC